MTDVQSNRRARRAQRALESHEGGLPSLKFTTMCKFHLMNKCVRGSSCTFAHDESQLRGKPDLTGTKICRFFATGRPCRYGSRCTHAHALAESSESTTSTSAGEEEEEDSPRYVHVPGLTSMSSMPLSKDIPPQMNIQGIPAERVQLLAALRVLDTWVNQCAVLIAKEAPQL
ncbi:Zinc finger protein LEE1 [Symbiodinium microadriaticum]|uniref:Zinc finger protein LEE1 n=1 Tax=Symbiodinium microadriaticum TaxID=2951 RepID=A0A1Q9D5P6_SYMMI|nr:Zinc finger protein LEE1 [Symbiodinium microadriaticum]CAE7485765.1 LEE1 [Symbiodinium microadriaticum]CAE7518209.1 LEE1 [Symbiodinium sp. KB8]